MDILYLIENQKFTVTGEGEWETNWITFKNDNNETIFISLSESYFAIQEPYRKKLPKTYTIVKLSN